MIQHRQIQLLVNKQHFMKGMTKGYQFYDNLSKLRVIRFEFEGPPPKKKFFFYPFPADFYLKSNT